MPEQPRPNVFQRLVKQWESIHPYNGAQLMLVGGDAPASLAAAWREATRALDLSDLAGELREEARSPDEVLTAELNFPYADAANDFPLRPICIREGGAHWMGIAYRHWLADSVAVRMALREWFGLAHGAREMVAGRPLRRSAGGYWKLFGPDDAGGGDRWSLLRGLLEGARQTSRMKRVQRVEGAGRDAGFGVEFSLHRPPDGTIGRVLAWARSRRMKVNDVLLAALAEAVNEHGGLQRTSRRQDVAMGSIVDLRPHSSEDLSGVFSLYLGFTTIFLRPQHFADFDVLVRQVARQHEVGRASRAASASMLRMTAGLATHNVLGSRRRVTEFYRKRLPLSAGISNVNLSQDGLARHHPDKVLRYIRASPTGPMMPLVISATTINGDFNFGLTRRASVISATAGEAVAAQIVERLSRLKV